MEADLESFDPWTCMTKHTTSDDSGGQWWWCDDSDDGIYGWDGKSLANLAFVG